MLPLRKAAYWLGDLAPRAGLIAAGLWLLAGILTLFGGGWSWIAAADNAISAALLTGGLGGLMGFGRLGQLAANPGYHEARTAGPTPGRQRAHHDAEAARPPIPLMIILLGGAALTAAIGFVIKALV